MRLHELLAGLPGAHTSGPADPEITSIAYDSRAVRPGALFVAVRGAHVDGHAYIGQALERGAVAVVVEADHRPPTADRRPPTADGERGRGGEGERRQSPIPNPQFPISRPVTWVRVASSRAALAPIAAAFYGYPGAQMRVVGITGTDGKSTTTALTSAVLEAGGHTTGMAGTVDFKVAGRQWANDTRQSTPEAPEVQTLLREMVAAGCGYAVLEATSHALSARWNRLGGALFDVAVLTNVTHEHLDYHGSVEQYRRDKARLFEMLGEGQEPRTKLVLPLDKLGNREVEGNQEPDVSSSVLGSQFSVLKEPDVSSSVLGSQFSVLKGRKVAIVNADDPYHQMFLDAAPARAERLTYAALAPADVRARDVVSTRDGLRFRVETPWGAAALRLKLTGDFNVANALAALAVGLAEGVPLDQCVRALEAVPGVRGRMERIEAGQPFTVLVDYAHTPGSFEKLMRIVRPLTDGQLIAVFGSAGERDREKRAIQGEVAARFCDLLVLTDEDPRMEDREAIIDEIAAGAERGGKRAGAGYLRIPDRPAAIRAAFERARPGDIVLLLGKGHEGCMIYGQERVPWDEAAEARAALRELGYSDSGGQGSGIRSSVA